MTSPRTISLAQALRDEAQLLLNAANTFAADSNALESLETLTERWISTGKALGSLKADVQFKKTAEALSNG